MKILTIIGARPQFIKAASLSREIAKCKEIEEVIIHTGQHYDFEMSDLFFSELKLPNPNYNLSINNLNHGAMTGRMMEELEKILIIENPEWVIVYGDTNTTLAGAITAKKLKIKVAHVEAGLRSFDMNMPEEVNRIIIDRISDLLFCPTIIAKENLKNEGFTNLNCKVINVGDIMLDSALYYNNLELKIKDFSPESYILGTIHREENTDDEKKIRKIFSALDQINNHYPVILPLHPRTKERIEHFNIKTNIKIINPVGYIEMIHLIKNSKAIITDSGGLQKDAYFFNKQCFTLRNQTEWLELINSGCNQLIDVNNEDIAEVFLKNLSTDLVFSKPFYGDGTTSSKIIQALINF